MLGCDHCERRAKCEAECLEWTGRNPERRWWSPPNVLPGDRLARVNPQPGLVVTFGLISAIKSLEVARDALAMIRPTFPNLRWRIVGPFNPISNPYHADLAKRLPEEWIEFTGGFEDVNDPRLRALLAEGAAMLLPFADGASPRRGTLQTAWAFGMPVITTAPAYNESCLIDGGNCILVKGENPEAWARELTRVLSEPALSDRLRYHARITAEDFSWNRLVDCHVQLYQQIIDVGRPKLLPILEPFALGK